MQTNLFGNAFPSQEAGINRMYRFEFDAALEQLQIARELNPEIPNNRFYCEIGVFCQAKGLTASTPATDIAALWEAHYAEQSNCGETTPRLRFLFELFSRRLLELNAFDADGYLPGRTGVLHISACLVHAKEEKAAYQKLLDLLTADGAPPAARFWGYFGDVCMALKKQREANLGYLHLLATDPSDVDWSTFRHSDLRALFMRLRSEHDVQYAYCCWPFYAWSRGLVEIPENSSYIKGLVEQHRVGVASEPDLLPAERAQRFCLLVFYEQSMYPASPDVELRQRMQRLDGRLFREYLELCRRRQRRR